MKDNYNITRNYITIEVYKLSVTETETELETEITTETELKLYYTA